MLHVLRVSCLNSQKVVERPVIFGTPTEFCMLTEYLMQDTSYEQESWSVVDFLFEDAGVVHRHELQRLPNFLLHPVVVILFFCLPIDSLCFFVVAG